MFSRQGVQSLFFCVESNSHTLIPYSQDIVRPNPLPSSSQLELAAFAPLETIFRPLPLDQVPTRLPIPLPARQRPPFSLPACLVRVPNSGVPLDRGMVRSWLRTPLWASFHRHRCPIPPFHPFRPSLPVPQDRPLRLPTVAMGILGAWSRVSLDR